MGGEFYIMGAQHGHDGMNYYGKRGNYLLISGQFY